MGRALGLVLAGRGELGCLFLLVLWVGALGGAEDGIFIRVGGVLGSSMWLCLLSVFVPTSLACTIDVVLHDSVTIDFLSSNLYALLCILFLDSFN